MDNETPIQIEDINDFGAALSDAVSDTETFLYNKQESIKFFEAKKILEILERDIVKVILLSCLKKRRSFQDFLESTGVDPYHIDRYVDSLIHLGLLGKIFVRGSPYYPKYKTTDFAKLILRDLFDLKKENAEKKIIELVKQL